jgi:hypothetical protein
MINLELQKRYFKTLDDGSSEFEYVVNQLLPDHMRYDYDLSEIDTCHLDASRWLILIKNDTVEIEIDLCEDED